MCLGHGIHLALATAAPKPTAQNRPVKEYRSPSHPRGSELEWASQGIGSLTETVQDPNNLNSSSAYTSTSSKGKLEPQFRVLLDREVLEIGNTLGTIMPPLEGKVAGRSNYQSCYPARLHSLTLSAPVKDAHRGR